MQSTIIRRTTGILALVIAAAFAPASLCAHCDTMDGPVVTAGVRALETGNVNLALVWVRDRDEATVREAFRTALSVRKLNAEAQRLADRYFLETLVRIHREGEGVAYTGLKPAGTEPGPGIAAADRAIETGSTVGLLRHLDESIGDHIRAGFDALLAMKGYDSDDLAAGREYVKKYVEFIHYVEGLHAAITGPAEGHLHEQPAAGH